VSLCHSFDRLLHFGLLSQTFTAVFPWERYLAICIELLLCDSCWVVQIT
jgi:hypothetical protein